MICVHGVEKVGCGFLVWFFLFQYPVHAKAVAEATEHSHEEHGGGLAHSAQIIEVADVEALVEPAFDTPGGAVEFEPVEGV